MTTDIEQIVEPARSIEAMWQEILDKDDRNSPSEYPEMVMLTFDEFKAYVEEGRESLLAALKEAQERGEALAESRDALLDMGVDDMNEIAALRAERDALAAERDEMKDITAHAVRCNELEEQETARLEARCDALTAAIKGAVEALEKGPTKEMVLAAQLAEHNLIWPDKAPTSHSWHGTGAASIAAMWKAMAGKCAALAQIKAALGETEP